MSSDSAGSLSEDSVDKIKHAVNHSPAFIEAVFAGLGPFSAINDAPWDDLSEGQKAVRKELAEADRSGLRLASLRDVYRALVGSSGMAGKYIRLGTKFTVIGLDSSRRRWLQTVASKKTVEAMTTADEPSQVRRILARPGATVNRWSIDRYDRIPDPKWVTKKLHLPEGGCFLGIYSGTPDVLDSESFVSAAAVLVSELEFSDFLFWDTEHDREPVLWSVMAGFGCRTLEDAEWPPGSAETAGILKRYLTGEN